jgi:hypothetical protein
MVTRLTRRTRVVLSSIETTKGAERTRTAVLVKPCVCRGSRARVARQRIEIIDGASTLSPPCRRTGAVRRCRPRKRALWNRLTASRKAAKIPNASRKCRARAAARRASFGRGDSARRDNREPSEPRAEGCVDATVTGPQRALLPSNRGSAHLRSGSPVPQVKERGPVSNFLPLLAESSAAQ